MEEKVNYLPLGSVVNVHGGVKKYIIIARGLQVNVEGEKYYFDYGACMYPEGLIGDQVMYFQHDNIKKVIFEGYSDEDNQLMLETIQENYEKMGLEHADVSALKGIAGN